MVTTSLSFVIQGQSRFSSYRCGACGIHVPKNRGLEDCAGYELLLQARKCGPLDLADQSFPIPQLPNLNTQENQTESANMKANYDSCRIYCHGGCGEVYCSLKCEATAWNRGHCLVCVGPLSSIDHPLCLLKKLCAEMGEEVFLAIQILCAALVKQGEEESQHQLLAQQSLHSLVIRGLSKMIVDDENENADDDGEYTKNDDDGEYTKNDDAGSDWEKETLRLFLEGLFQTHNISEIVIDECMRPSLQHSGSLLTCWRALLREVELCSIQVELESPILEYCRQLNDPQLSSAEDILIPYFTAIEELRKEEDAAPLCPDGWTLSLTERADSLILPWRAVALFPQSTVLLNHDVGGQFEGDYSHSCLPSHEYRVVCNEHKQAEIETGEDEQVGLKLNFMKIAAEKGGEDRTNHQQSRCFVEVSANLKRRRAELFDRFGVERCHCVRCQWEEAVMDTCQWEEEDVERGGQAEEVLNTTVGLSDDFVSVCGGLKRAQIILLYRLAQKLKISKVILIQLAAQALHFENYEHALKTFVTVLCLYNRTIKVEATEEDESEVVYQIGVTLRRMERWTTMHDHCLTAFQFYPNHKEIAKSASELLAYNQILSSSTTPPPSPFCSTDFDIDVHLAGCSGYEAEVILYDDDDDDEEEEEEEEEEQGTGHDEKEEVSEEDFTGEGNQNKRMVYKSNAIVVREGDTPRGLFTPEECSWVISVAEAHAQERGGWTTARHYSVPTTDIPVHQIPSLLPWFNDSCRMRLFPLLARLYPQLCGSCSQGSQLRINDAFVVKYEYEAKQRHLPLHTDQSVLSLTIALNEQADDESAVTINKVDGPSVLTYQGGGTYFESLQQTIVPSAGSVAVFPGELSHGGRMISSGVRYIIALFLYVYHPNE